MADAVYNKFKKEALHGNDLDLVTDTIKCALVTSSYTPDVDGDTTYADITNEVTDTGYSAGGAEITSRTVTQDDTDNEGVFDGADVTWATSEITARGAVVYRSTTATQSWLICYFDFGADKTSSGGDFTVQWDAEGIVNLT